MFEEPRDDEPILLMDFVRVVNDNINFATRALKMSLFMNHMFYSCIRSNFVGVDEMRLSLKHAADV